MTRTRVKICGLTRPEDVEYACRAGADALGFVFYPPSPRFLTIEHARELRRAVPPFVTLVALFVNAPRADIDRVIGEVGPDMLQFHGDETPGSCEQTGLPYIKTCRMQRGVDLLEYLAPYRSACGWLADAYVEGYGGKGTRFDWTEVPRERPRPLILSGGLTPDNVREAITTVRPWGVDISSGVESAPGIKDASRITAFMAEVRNADV